MDEASDLFDVFDSAPDQKASVQHAPLLGDMRQQPSKPGEGHVTLKLPIVVDVSEPPAPDPLKSIRHSVVFPHGSHIPEDPQDPIYTCPLPQNMAKTYTYDLDPFQVRSIGALARNESVLVSAHTSAGKTTVAEYAIAQCLRNGQKIIYTSPIKALSNQKYRDLRVADYTKGSVGLMTGDTTLKRDADVIVMTTEVLRNMLQNGSQIVREIGYVIFDEVHYMRNAERGVVWEDTISMLNSKIRFVFLSATVPNASEFAGWVAHLHSQPVHVVYTEFRPVPLIHYVCPVGGTGVYPICTSSDKAGLRTDQIAKAKAALPLLSSGQGMAGSGAPGGPGGPSGSNQDKRPGAKNNSSSSKMQAKLSVETLNKTLSSLVQKNAFPIIVFAFGRKKCEKLAVEFVRSFFNVDSEQPTDGQGERVNLLTPQQVKEVDCIFDAALQDLPEADRQLSPIVSMHKLLRKGVAIHHSGLLPWVKELVEVLFAEDLVKILYATETFSMGLNLPARTVLFCEFTKFDGTDNRYLSPGEYIQMAGRAGRRGLDTQGLSISLFNTAEECDAIVKVVQGTTEPLNSAYRLSFNAILNLMRIDVGSSEEQLHAGTDGPSNGLRPSANDFLSPEHVIRRSFLQFQEKFRLPRCMEELKYISASILDDRKLFTETFADAYSSVAQQLQLSLDMPTDSLLSCISNYVNILALVDAEQHTLSSYIDPLRLQAIMDNGRLIRVSAAGIDFGWVPVVNTGHAGDVHFVDVLAPCYPVHAEGYSKKSSLPSIFLTEQASSGFQKLAELNACCSLIAGLEDRSNYDTLVDQVVGAADNAAKDGAPDLEAEPASKAAAARSSKKGKKRPAKPRTLDCSDSNLKIDSILFGNSLSLAYVSEANLATYPFIPGLQPYAALARLNMDLITPRNILEDIFSALELIVRKPSTEGSIKPSAIIGALKNKYVPYIIRVPFSCVTAVSKMVIKGFATELSDFVDKTLACNNYLGALYTLLIRCLPKGLDKIASSLYSTLLDCVAFPDSEPFIKTYELFEYSSDKCGYDALQCHTRIRKLRALLQQDYHDIHLLLTQRVTGSCDKSIQLRTLHSGYNATVSIAAATVFPILLTAARKMALESALQQHIKKADDVVLQAELNKMKAFLLRTGYLEAQGANNEAVALTAKGKVACHINAANEIVCTECLFNKVFTNISPAILCGLLGSLLAERVSDSQKKPKLPNDLSDALGSLVTVVDDLLLASTEEGVELEHGCDSTDKMVGDSGAAIAHAWAQGKDLQSVIDIDKSVFEGSIVRMLKRSVTLVEQLIEACSGINDSILLARLTKLLDLVNRGMVKCTSLYVVDETDL